MLVFPPLPFGGLHLRLVPRVRVGGVGGVGGGAGGALGPGGFHLIYPRFPPAAIWAQGFFLSRLGGSLSSPPLVPGIFFFFSTRTPIITKIVEYMLRG